MSRILSVELRDTKLEARTELLSWLCSVDKGKEMDKYWIVKTDTQIFNQYNDPDVNYLMNMLLKVHIAGYESLMILKHKTDNEQPQYSHASAGEESGNSSDSEGVSGEESLSEVPPSSSESGYSRAREDS